MQRRAWTTAAALVHGRSEGLQAAAVSTVMMNKLGQPQHQYGSPTAAKPSPRIIPAGLTGLRPVVLHTRTMVSAALSPGSLDDVAQPACPVPPHHLIGRRTNSKPSLGWRLDDAAGIMMRTCTLVLSATWHPSLLAARRLRKEPEPFEAEFDEDEFEHGEYEDLGPVDAYDEYEFDEYEFPVGEADDLEEELPESGDKRRVIKPAA